MSNDRAHDKMFTMKTLYWGAVIAYVLVRGVMITLNYLGDESEVKVAEARRHFSDEEIRQGVAYHRDGIWITVARAAILFAVPFILLMTGLAQWFAVKTLGWSGGRPWLQIVIFATALVVLETVLTLPFNYYFFFVREHRFGLSNQSSAQWFAYFAKSAALNLAITTIMVSLLYVTLRRFPTAWVYIIPAGVTVIAFILSILWPRIILPIFYQVAPLERTERTEDLYRTAESAGIAVERIHVIDESRYSKHTNAFVTGWGTMKSIYVYDTLLKENTPSESAVILAHEIGHWKRQHVLKYLLMGGLATFFGCLILKAIYPKLQDITVLNVGGIEEVSSLPLLLILMTMAMYFVMPGGSWISRTFEREADRDSITVTQDRLAYRSAFVKLGRENKSFVFPHPAVVAWSYSHPPILERLAMVDDNAPDE